MNNTEALTLDGFPAVACDRCFGRGVMDEYRNNHGGRCYKCHGTGRFVAREYAARYAAWKAAVEQATAATFGDLAEGDEIRYDGKRRTIVEVMPDDYNAGNMVYVTRSGLRLSAKPSVPVTRYVAAEDLPKAADYLK